MAKRAPAGETPFRPLLDRDVLSALLVEPERDTAHNEEPNRPPKVVELLQPEASREESQNIAPKQPAVQWATHATTHPVADLGEKIDQEKRMLVTKSDNLRIDRFMGSLSASLNTQVKLSHVMRGFVMLLLSAEGAVDRRAREAAGMIRPSNGDPKALKAFEREIAHLLIAALRDAGTDT